MGDGMGWDTKCTEDYYYKWIYIVEYDDDRKMRRKKYVETKSSNDERDTLIRLGLFELRFSRDEWKAREREREWKR